MSVRPCGLLAEHGPHDWWEGDRATSETTWACTGRDLSEMLLPTTNPCADVITVSGRIFDLTDVDQRAQAMQVASRLSADGRALLHEADRVYGAVIAVSNRLLGLTESEPT